MEYGKLRAFETSDGRGWGLCCARCLRRGDVVVEVDGAEVGGDVAEVTRLLAGATERRLVVKRAPRAAGWW